MKNLHFHLRNPESGSAEPGLTLLGLDRESLLASDRLSLISGPSGAGSAAPPPRRDLRSYYTHLKTTKFKVNSLSETLRSTDVQRSEVRQLKAAIVSRMKQHFVMEGEVRELDSKIKLLVANRITVEKVLAHQANVSRMTAKAARRSIETESHPSIAELLLLLQSRPYLARLVVAPRLTLADTKLLVQLIVFTLFGDQYERREERLLLALFSEALRLEMEACQDQGSYNRGNTVVTKMLTQ